MTGSRSRTLIAWRYGGCGMGDREWRIHSFCGKSAVRAATCVNFSAAWLTLSRSTPILSMNLRVSIPVITCREAGVGADDGDRAGHDLPGAELGRRRLRYHVWGRQRQY